MIPKKYLLSLILFALGSWIAFHIPTFDLDESLYRIVSQEMMQAKNYWLPTWDAVPLFHKPPFFYWLIILFQKLIAVFTSETTTISILAARLPSWFATLGICWTLYQQKPEAPLYFTGALFCLLTSVAVIFDPIQSLFLLNGLISLNKSLTPTFEEPKAKLPLLMSIVWITLATLFKGLNGIILPMGAFAFKLLETWIIGTRKNYFEHFKFQLKQGSLIFFGGSFLSFLGFLLLDQKMGHSFTREFFLVHHLGRGQSAMEAHSGFFGYYLVVLILGSGPLLTLWLKNIDFSVKNSLFLYFAIFTFTFFTLAATQLPHYLWPLWPVLALTHSPLPQHSSSKESKIKNFLIYSPWSLFLFSIFVYILGGLFPLLWLHDLPVNLLNTLGSVAPLQSNILLVGIFILMFGLLVSIKSLFQFIQKQNFTSTFLLSSALSFLGFSICAYDISTRWVQAPLDHVSAYLKTEAKTDPPLCIRYQAPLSPSFSLALAPELKQGHCDLQPLPGNYLVTPEWKKDGCSSLKLPVLFQYSYLMVCGIKKNLGP